MKSEVGRGVGDESGGPVQDGAKRGGSPESPAKYGIGVTWDLLAASVAEDLP